ncbi:hypothetical protein HK100_009228 [Physocladia obscura]|uniref:Uncharacterized protein n=1 Tax=Physocladia obscura TaxID=109957 RepID=A0AAD5X632_9FUNG|nr:hypothetical protein HK100_009228 [Physocladia obscura]
MQLINTAVFGLGLALAGMANGQCTASPGGTCVTSGGGWLSIISPFTNATFTSGGSILTGGLWTQGLTWNVCGSDATFNAAEDASDIGNIVSIPDGALGQAVANAGQLTSTVPTGIPNSKTYAIKSSYFDTNSKWVYCFGNLFAVTGEATASATGSAPAATTSASAADHNSNLAAAAAAGALALAALL